MGVPRKVRQIAAGLADGVLYALADDGSLWFIDARGRAPEWCPVPGLPDAEACGARFARGDGPPCRLAKGHRDNHWSGERNWT